VDPWEVAAREAIRDTIARYAHAADTGRFDDLAACFTEDGVLEIAVEETELAESTREGGGLLEGRAAIVESLRGVGRELAAATTVPYVRHHVSSTLIELHGRDGATARSYFFVVTERGPDHWGRYRDTLAERDGRWLFTHRLARTDGTAPGGWAAERRSRARP
jgi:ketosteroid isomerase-like protein